MTVRELKDRLLEGKIELYAWLPTQNMWTDVLTKEMQIHIGLEKILNENKMDLLNCKTSKVSSRQ